MIDYTEKNDIASDSDIAAESGRLLELAMAAALMAGSEIMGIYEEDFAVEYKQDQSPLTEADRAAHHLICDRLQATGLPILSEESRAVAYAERGNWHRFWLVDPLDGTKEFVRRNGEFTVNIALIDDARPIMGVVYAPVLDTAYCGIAASSGSTAKAWKASACEGKDAAEIIASAQPCGVDPAACAESVRVVASRSHCNEETLAFIRGLEDHCGPAELVSSGSSLKLCLLADGRADIYPRIAPTMEWDTAAAQAVLAAAGGRVLRYDPALAPIDYLRDRPDSDRGAVDLRDLEYNKEELLNPYFVAVRKRQ